MAPLIEPTDRGISCPAGEFHIDPWRPVPRAVVTHAHSDHACRGCGSYLTARAGLDVLRARLGPDATIETIDYGQSLEMGGVRLSLHPAGHVLGSAQVRLEREGFVAVVAGDYKLAADPTCRPFEPVRCHLFLTESTFGLPVYRWRPASEILQDINAWWCENADAGRASVLFAYALGKAQRVLAMVDGSIGPLVTHGAVEVIAQAYRESGAWLPPTRLASDVADRGELRRALVVAPPSAQGTPWLRRFGPASFAFASGWMRIRGARRRRAIDRGFVLSDHADWPGLLAAIEATGAQEVWVTHGYSAVLARWLIEKGQKARVVSTGYEGEADGEAAESAHRTGDLGDATEEEAPP
jgi:putative mRNA 3-end processing factor